MADLLLGAVLGFVAKQLTSKFMDVIDGVQSFSKSTKEVEKLTSELFTIQKLIEDADKRSIVDETKKKLVMDLIEIAYQMEDALDIFSLECPNALSGIKRLPRKVSKLRSVKKFYEEMKDIRSKISKIHEYRNINNEINPVAEHTQSKSALQLDLIGDPEVVGFDEHKKNIVKNLCDVNNRRLAVVSIVGPGGVDKTALARKVCYSEDVRREFGEPKWITISQNYDFFDVLRKIAKSFNVGSNGSDAKELASKISEHLKEINKKYLIVLDDVWTKELCDELLTKGVLFNLENGSRVLITTRLVVDVAWKADTTYEPYQLEVLKDNESLDLFSKHAIPTSQQRSEGSTPNLEDLREKIMKKCKGLPLALIVLGRFLSMRACTYNEWNKLLETMRWHDDGIECTKVIATSFEHLPFASKLCFMYFAAFPEDHKIEAQPLLRMWIAEGLIQPEEGRTLEQTAERFLQDLVQRSMVQVSRRYPDGSIKYLTVHDVLKDIAIQKAKEKNFLVVCSKQDDWKSQHCRVARRIAVHYSDFNESMQQYANPNLRSLLIFGESKLDCSKFRLLRVLATIGKEVELQSFKRLPCLRYLQLNKKANSGSYFHIEERMNTMKSLQTLDFRSASYGDLTPLWKIKTLRHVLLPSSSTQCNGPLASGNLPNLQTLRGVRYNKCWEISGFPNIPEVRELDIQIVRPYKFEVFVALLGKLKHLVYLTMNGEDIQIQNFEGVFPFLENLKHMVVTNIYGESFLELKDNMLPPNLIVLYLDGFEFKSDPMPVLEKLGSLKILALISHRSRDTYPLRFRCSADGFKRLEKLSLQRIEMLLEWKIERDSMPMLKWLNVYKCDNLPVPPELIHHESLRFLGWRTRSTTDLDRANADKIIEIFRRRPDMQEL